MEEEDQYGNWLREKSGRVHEQPNKVYMVQPNHYMCAFIYCLHNIMRFMRYHSIKYGFSSKETKSRERKNNHTLKKKTNRV